MNAVFIWVSKTNFQRFKHSNNILKKFYLIISIKMYKIHTSTMNSIPSFISSSTHIDHNLRKNHLYSNKWGSRRDRRAGGRVGEERRKVREVIQFANFGENFDETTLIVVSGIRFFISNLPTIFRTNITDPGWGVNNQGGGQYTRLGGVYIVCSLLKKVSCP